MKVVIACSLLLTLVAVVQNVPVDESDRPSLLSELSERDVLVVSPEELQQQGYGDVDRIRICIASQCNSRCKSLGYAIGLCSTNAYCVCFR